MQRVPDVPWRGVVTGRRLYSKDGAVALEFVRVGVTANDLAEAMGQPGHRGWAMVWSHYARHIAEGPLA